ncbi:MAG: hypothetical protein ACE5I1_06290 [bacterium]
MGNLRSFLCLMWVFSACQVPTEPEDQAETAKRLTESQTFTIQLLAGRVKYAAYIGGGEWRATFETKILVDSTENIRDQCEITFFWKTKASRPSANEDGWISAGNASQAYPHGLMSIDGHWIDRHTTSTLPYWMRARITHDAFDSAIDVIGKCNFLESVERPETAWISTIDLGYGLGDRILARLSINSSNVSF